MLVVLVSRLHQLDGSRHDVGVLGCDVFRFSDVGLQIEEFDRRGGFFQPNRLPASAKQNRLADASFVELPVQELVPLLVAVAAEQRGHEAVFDFGEFSLRVVASLVIGVLVDQLLDVGDFLFQPIELGDLVGHFAQATVLALQGEHPFHVREHGRVLQLPLDFFEALQFRLQAGVHVGERPKNWIWNRDQKAERVRLPLSCRVTTATAQRELHPLECVPANSCRCQTRPAGASDGSYAPLTFQLYFLANFSTRPALSTNFIVPVKNGWHCEQISTCSFTDVLRVLISVPQLQWTMTSWYLGWMPSFMATPETFTNDGKTAARPPRPKSEGAESMGTHLNRQVCTRMSRTTRTDRRSVRSKYSLESFLWLMSIPRRHLFPNRQRAAPCRDGRSTWSFSDTSIHQIGIRSRFDEHRPDRRFRRIQLP